MVAYNFKKKFAYPVTQGYKVQTIRAPRKNGHVKAGGAIQLYTGMRTSNCEKLVNPDPICKAVFSIDIKGHGDVLIDRCPLTLEQIRQLALADGFIDTIPGLGESGPTINAETHMIEFFADKLPCLGFSLIYWGPDKWWDVLDFLPDLVIENHDRLAT
ncbi:hypothetical protein [Adonisia turfae]|uniref:Uncharacterized protein n=1 Tax=Adonisia turfae CCMR0081 TaxID=2292702 RepID=A0A6M0RI97_9CYAN|nr:hypothetical protein [Adonisia turfae]NEZ55472.1 hypothetical protein [Adonisia turfae CCMR0081]